MKKEIYTCDIGNCGNNDIVHKHLQVIFHTEQTEGRNIDPHLSSEELDICSECLKKVLSGNYVHGSGAQGYNQYWFQKDNTISKKLELASNLAHNRTLHESGDICNNEDDMYVDINSDTLTYKEEIQDRFNTWYDYYLTQIESVL